MSDSPSEKNPKEIPTRPLDMAPFPADARTLSTEVIAPAREDTNREEDNSISEVAVLQRQKQDWKIIDQTCDQFTEAWENYRSSQGARPSIREILDNQPHRLFAELLEQLLGCELEQREAIGEKPEPKTYEAFFPDQRERIGKVFREWDPTLISAEPLAIGNYEILHELGRGAMGVVYRARQKSLDRVVALKMILPGSHPGKPALSRFQLEAEILARLQHPHIVQIFEVGSENDLPYFSMELVEGCSLAERIQGRPLPPRESAVLLETMARAIAGAHQKDIVHRDLKPGNVLLAGAGEMPLDELVPKITDFGLARRFDRKGAQTQDGALIGTPNYMAPEQARGKVRELGPSVDIYALGAILYEMITGRPPFQGTNLWEVLEKVIHEEPLPPQMLSSGIPIDLQTICLKCLQKKADHRYHTAEELADDLRRFLDGKPILARPVTRWERAWKWAQRHPAVASLLLVIFLLSVGIGMGGVVYARHESNLRKMAESNLRLSELYLSKARAALLDLARLGHQRLAHEPRYEALRKDILERTLALNQELLKINQTDPRHQWHVGQTWLYVAEILENLGRTKDAIAGYQSALAHLNQVSPTPTNRHQVQMAIGTAWHNLSVIHTALRRFPEADTAWKKAMAIHTALHQDQPSSETVVAILSTWIERGRYALLQRDAPSAVQSYQKAIDQIKDWKGERSIRFQEMEAIAYVDLGRLRTTPPVKAKQALEAYATASDLWKALLKKHNEPRYRKRIAEIHNNRGALYQMINQPLQARADLQMAQSVLEALVKDFPLTIDYRVSLTATYRNLGAALLDDFKKPAEAATVLQQAASHLEWLRARERRDPGLKRSLGLTLNDLARARFGEGAQKAPEAVGHWREAIALQESLTALDPGQEDYWTDLLKSRKNLAQVQLSQWYLKAIPHEVAQEECKRWMDAHQQRAQHFPGKAMYRQQWQQACNTIARIYKEADRPKEAEQWQQRAQKIAKTDHW